ncbi:MAG: serine acetyltransferase [Tannerella sp.]|jgi:serine O-acetyltransferase|nr:serine acetyltransferase [Tannerella sp.]
MNHSTDSISRLKTVERFMQDALDGATYFPQKSGRPLPGPEQLKRIVDLVKEIVFPGFFSASTMHPLNQRCCMGTLLDHLNVLLKEQIANGLYFFAEADAAKTDNDAPELALAFIERLPEVRRLLYTDVKAMFNNDPATDSFGEVIICYPSIQAMIHYRIAHELLLLDVPVLPRIITELAHSAIGIDIHPGARIGEYFSIDHGTGVVIGETCIIGNHVHLYQGVTLGARNFVLDERGLPLNVPRHPILEDNVIVYSNSTVLGRITIGHNSVIGGNVWLTGSVPPHSRIVQRRASAGGTSTDLFSFGEGI